MEKSDKIEDANTLLKYLQDNLDKIKNEEDIKWINFKSGLLETKAKTRTPKEIERSSDVLNKVINAFQDKKAGFFKV